MNTQEYQQAGAVLLDKVVLLTGASRGIGNAICHALLANGAIVYATATTDAGSAAIHAQFGGEFGDKIIGCKLDITQKNQLVELIGTIEKQHGAVDILVNNAGITRDSLLLRMDDDKWQQVIDANLTGAYNACRAVVKGMVKRRGGVIINISSVVALMGNAGQCNYAAAKAGLIGFSKSLALELGSRGIRVNCIAPGFIATDMTTATTDISARIPLGHIGCVADIAHAVIYLAGSGGRYITGTCLNVSGGLYC